MSLTILKQNSKIEYQLGDILGEECKFIIYTKVYKSRKYAKFECRCGKEFEADIREIKRLKTRSCGCLAIKLTKERSTKHGLFGTPEYQAWNSMRNRCLNTKNKHYHNYGGRGISICKEWINSPETFVKDMGLRPSPTHSLDRIRVNENYQPDNCKWSNLDEQNNNKRNTIKIEYKGELLSFSQLSKKLNLNYNTLLYRYHKGLRNPEELFATYKLTNL